MRPLDYRTCHLARGPDYDQALADSPFDAFMCEREAWILAGILAERFPDGVDRYLDFACGTGRIATIVSHFADQTVGIDLSPSIVAIASRKLPHAQFVVADITRSLPALEPFDLVTAFRFVGNAQDDLREAALHGLHRLLKPGGLLILNNHRNPLAAKYLLSRLARRRIDGRLDLTLSKLEGLLGRTGFEVEARWGIGWWVIAGSRMPWNGVRMRRELGGKRQRRWASLASISPDMVLVARRKR